MPYANEKSGRMEQSERRMWEVLVVCLAIDFITARCDVVPNIAACVRFLRLSPLLHTFL